jgi:hypothetical protein
MRPFGIRRLTVFLGLSIGLCLPAPGGFDLAFAESSKGLELIAHATKAYEGGAYTDAATSIDEAFKAGLTGEYAARAILLRAEVNERTGKLASALQDYSNALWMESLPATERRKASEGKERVMSAMGLGGSPSSQQASFPASRAENSSSGGIFGMFNGLFGSSSSPPPPPPAEPQKTWNTSTAAPAQTEASPVKKAPTVAAVKRATPVQTASIIKPASAPPVLKRQAALQTTSAASVASPSDGFLIVFGSLNSQGAAQTKAQQIKAQLSGILVGRNVDVEPGSGGYQLVAGPYKAKSSALALCSAMKQRGVSCQVTP